MANEVMMWPFLDELRRRKVDVHGIRIVPHYDSGRPYGGDAYTINGFTSTKVGVTVDRGSGQDFWSDSLLQNWKVKGIVRTRVGKQFNTIINMIPKGDE